MPSPFIEVHIDFDEDKILESDEEVSGDLRSYLLTRGKDVQSNRAPASTLLMTMNDKALKYMPPNTSSPLFPFQLPGPDIRVRMAYPYDAFTGSNGTSLNGRTMPQADDQTKDDPAFGDWIADSEFEIETNHIEVTAGGNDLTAVVEFDLENVRLGADIIRESGSISYPYKQSLFTFRYQDNSNYNEIFLFATSAIAPLIIRVGKVVAGTPTNYGSTFSSAVGTTFWDQGDSARVEVEIHGPEVMIYINDYLVHITKDADTFSTATKHGIGGEFLSANAVSGGAGSRLVQWDNFGGWVTAFSGRTDEVEPLPGEDPTSNIAAWDDFERLNRHPVFVTTEPPETSGDLVAKVIVATDVLEDRPLLNGSNPGIDQVLLTDAGVTLNTDFAKAMGASGLEELYQIQDDEVGFIWIDGRGLYRFEASDHRDNAPHDASIATWETDSDDPDKPYISRDPKLKWKDGKDIVENEIYYRYDRAAKAVGATVWVLEIDDNPDMFNAVALGAWRTIEIVAIDTGNAIGNVIQPVPGSDYTIDENADGTGVDYLENITSEIGTVSMSGNTLDDTGQNFNLGGTIGAGSFTRSRQLIVITDNSGNTRIAYGVSMGTSDPDGDGTRIDLTDWPEDPGGVGFPGSPGFIAQDSGFSGSDTPLTYRVMLSAAYLLSGFEGEIGIIKYLTTRTAAASNFLTSGLLKADQTVGSNPTGSRSLDSVSVSKFGRRRVDHQTKYIDLWDTAKGRSDTRLAQRKDERERLIVTLHNNTKRNLMEMLYRDVSDRIGVNWSAGGLSDRNYWIESYIMQLDLGAKRIEMQFTLVKVI